MDLRDPTRKVFFSPGQRRYLRGTIANRNLNLIAMGVISYGVVYFGAGLLVAKPDCLLFRVTNSLPEVKPKFIEFEPPTNLTEEQIEAQELLPAIKKYVKEDMELLVTQFQDIADTVTGLLGKSKPK